MTDIGSALYQEFANKTSVDRHFVFGNKFYQWQLNEQGALTAKPSMKFIRYEADD